jgi:hypothetical protein
MERRNQLEPLRWELTEVGRDFLGVTLGGNLHRVGSGVCGTYLHIWLVLLRASCDHCLSQTCCLCINSFNHHIHPVG